MHIPQYGAGGSPIRAPHISWEPLAVLDRPEQKASAVLRGLSAGAECYFIHSYAAVPKDPADCLAEVLYDGMPVCAAAAKGNVIGTQFHPEKSGEVGLQILRNYLSFCTETEGA